MIDKKNPKEICIVHDTIPVESPVSNKTYNNLGSGRFRIEYTLYINTSTSAKTLTCSLNGNLANISSINTDGSSPPSTVYETTGKIGSILANFPGRMWGEMKLKTSIVNPYPIGDFKSTSWSIGSSTGFQIGGIYTNTGTGINSLVLALTGSSTFYGEIRIYKELY